MNHEEMIGLLHDYARKKLNDEELLIVQDALENDQSLRAELKRVCAYYDDLKTLPEVKAPVDFLQKVRGRIERKSVLEKLRDLIFFPLYIKLPIEIAGTVAVAILVIIIINPLSTRVTVREKYTVTEYKASSDETSPNAFNNNKISNDERSPEKKAIASGPSRKTDRAIAYSDKAGARGAVRQSASFAEPMPSAQSSRRSFSSDGEFEGGLGLAEKSNRGEPEVITQDKTDALSRAKVAASAQPPAVKAGALKDEQQLASGYRSEADASSRAVEVSRELESSASAPAPSSASGGASINEQQTGPLADKKTAELSREQLAFTWTPEAPTENAPQSADYESLSKMEESKAAKPVRLKSKAVSAAKEESQASDQSIASNKLKSDNIAYLKTSIKQAGGSLKAVNQKALQYRIKIPAKNFKLLEEGLNRKGAFSSIKSVDLSRFSSNDTVEIIITIQE